MIWIQFVLIVGILFALLKFLTTTQTNKTKAWKKIIGILFTIVAIVIVLFPETANDVAHLVGVSRGADLLLYLLTLTFIFSSIDLYLKFQTDQKRLVELVRKVAILEANMKRSKRK